MAALSEWSAVTITAASALFSAVVFTMVQVALAYTIKPAITGAADWLLVVGLLAGFNLMALVVSLVVLSLFQVSGVALPALLAFLANAGLWALVPWGVVFANAGSRVPAGVYASIANLSGAEFVLAVPQFQAIFAVYYLPGVTWFWWLNLASFHGFLLAFLLAYRDPKSEVVTY